MRNWVILFLCSIAILHCNEVERSPNVVIILTDDQGWGDVTSNGNPDIDTPNLDQLVASGARFDRFFVSPVCAPTRASLLTGRDHLRTGTQWVTYGLENMNSEEVTFGEVFKNAGYQTGLFGKWHNGSHYPMDPNGQGFDTFFGFKMGHWNNYFDTELEYNGTMIKTEGYITDVLTDSALAFIERNKNAPFLTYIPYNAPHSPFQVPDQYFNKYKAEGLDDKNASVYGMVENIDDNIGRIIEKLDELELSENTIVIFLTDNGPNGGDRFNGNMKGWKAKVDEGGVRVPLFIKWPKRIPEETVVEELTAHIDFLPSIAELAGIEFEETNPIDGRSFVPLIFEDVPTWEDRYLFTHQSSWDSLEMYPASVRNNRYRAVQYGDFWELYDMQADPSQRENIAATNPELVAQFSGAYDAWFKEVSKDLPEKRNIPMGYTNAPTTILPAVESTFDGAIRFFGESGWSNDWLTNWTNESDKAQWQVDVVASGRYEVSLEYALKKSVSGVFSSTDRDGYELMKSIPVQQVKEVPSPDRVLRGEVYERRWATHTLGEIELEQGVQLLEFKLELEETSQPGFELKSLILHRIN